MHKTRRGCHG